MRINEVSPGEALRCAMQLIVDCWWRDVGQGAAWRLNSGDSNLQPLVVRALAVASRWTCVQWGCATGWWSEQGDEPEALLRERGLARIPDWVAALDSWDGPPCEGCVEAALDAQEREQLWGWVSVVRERVRQEPAAGVDGLISVFENALQVIPEPMDGRVVLRFGKANTAHARRKSGSYYTPQRIVDVVLQQTLERALDEHFEERTPPDRALRVVDPACGAGLFLVAAARRITARKLASLDESTRAAEWAAAFAATVRDNIFGVDSNPLAIEWCRLCLWSAAGDRSLDLASFAPGLRVGNALVGAPRDYWRGAPKNAWDPTSGDDKAEARRLRAQHAAELAVNCLIDAPPSERQRRWLADAWCAAFFWPKVAYASVNGDQEAAPTQQAVLRCVAALEDALPRGDSPATTRGTAPSHPLLQAVTELGHRHRFLHWPLEFASVFEAGGFDVVIGNPPWIAHAGRAAQALEPHLKHYFVSNYPSFTGYPSTHGLFVERAVSLLKIGGRLGFVLPASVSELGGYEATRIAHDRACDFDADLTDFGEGCFPGVTQPCMGLVSRRCEGGRTHGAKGAAWPMSRDDLGDVGAALLARLAALPVLPATLFGERGIQSDQRMKAHLSPGKTAHDRFTTPLREGGDIREFFLGEPRLWADWAALGRQARAVEEYAAVRFVVRQTASFPIATTYDGLPFRNSLLAGFGSEQWQPAVLVALLNSSVVRWHHYMRHRDARQPVLPQVKVGHLRSIPEPVRVTPSHLATLAALTKRFEAGETVGAERAELDRLVATMYDLSDAEFEVVSAWAEVRLGKARRRSAPGLPAGS